MLQLSKTQLRVWVKSVSRPANAHEFLDYFKCDVRFAWERNVFFTADERLSLNEIGYRLGFSSPSNFARILKRWTGVLPSLYRNPQWTVGHEEKNAV